MPSTVALCMPAFNREHLVAETLDSVLAQTWPHWELRVVDDGSTDRTKDIIAEYAARDPRIILTDRTTQPKGACTCRNEGVIATSAEYVMFLDTDDIIEPFCLENRVRVMDASPDLTFGIFPSLMFEKIPGDLRVWWNIDKPDTDELTRQFRQDAIAQGTGILFRRQAFIDIGMWDPELLMWQDIDLFFRAYIQGYAYGKFFDLPPDLHNRTNHGSLSRKDFFTPAKQESRATVLRRAVALLRENGMNARIPQARFMAAEVISGAARSGQMPLARQMLDWASREGVLTAREASNLRIVVLAHWTRATRLGPVRRRVEALLRPFDTKATLGRLPYTPTA
ncbi:glycosyltransferase family A protein [Sulfitobacter sp. JL08]|uniref:glycosyltransferase family A protein n=1 Tax=Sulfitobacter sp. JL08 TaxID=2070369 RepID=UPI0020C814B6|nr:glycosyltransferase family A protein [Sulfitobacter sp. JL08]